VAEASADGGACRAQRLQTESAHAVVGARRLGDSPTHACSCSSSLCALRLFDSVRTKHAQAGEVAQHGTAQCIAVHKRLRTRGGRLSAGSVEQRAHGCSKLQCSCALLPAG
jgi:hypothetical protein